MSKIQRTLAEGLPEHSDRSDVTLEEAIDAKVKDLANQLEKRQTQLDTEHARVLERHAPDLYL